MKRLMLTILALTAVAAAGAAGYVAGTRGLALPGLDRLNRSFMARLPIAPKAEPAAGAADARGRSLAGVRSSCGRCFGFEPLILEFTGKVFPQKASPAGKFCIARRKLFLFLRAYRP